MTLYKTFNYKIPIFYVPLKIIVGSTIEDAMKSRIFTSDDRRDYKDAAAIAFIHSGCIYIAIPYPDCDFQFAIHEIVHAKNFLYKMRGIHLDVENDENEAYLVQYIYEKCIDARRKFSNFVSKQRDNETITQQGVDSGRPRGEVQKEDSDPNGGDRPIHS